MWDTVQAVSSYVRGMLSSQAVMTGIGVGKEVRACGGGANGASHVRCVAVLQFGLYLGSLPGPSSLPRARHAGGSARHTVAVP